MRKEFQLTSEQLAELKNVSQPVPALALHCGEPSNPQARANAWWQKIGSELGFDYMTARPVPGKGECFFTAEVTA